MYAAIRRYKIKAGSANEITQRGQEGFVPLISGMPGFVAYYGVFTENNEIVTVKRLHRFIHDCGYEIAGPPEEEYLTKPGEEPKRTAIRFEISQLPH